MKAFERTNVLRGYEVDATRTTPMPVMFSFLEQLRWEWMSDPAWGLQEGLHTGHFFVVRRQHMELVERPRFGDALRITGEIETIGRSQIVVRHRLYVDDRAIGQARVTGVWLGPNRRLARLPDVARTLGRAQADAAAPFGVLAPLSAGDTPTTQSFLDAPRQLFAPLGLTLDIQPNFVADGQLTVTVRASDCDVFQHVNASEWLNYCNDVRLAVGLDGVCNHALIDYRQEALAGQLLTVDYRSLGDQLQFRIHRDQTLLCSAAMRLGVHSPPA